MEADLFPGGAEWRLPGRDFGEATRYVWIGVVVALLLLIPAGWWIVSHARDVEAALRAGTPWRDIVVEVLFLFPALILLIPAARILFTCRAVVARRVRTTVRLRDGELMVVEHFGGWRKTRRFDGARADTLVLSDNPDTIRPGWSDRRKDGPPARRISAGSIPLHTLQLRRGAERFTVAAVYPQDLLYQLGRELAVRLPGVRGLDLPHEESGTEVSVSPEPPREASPVPDPPSGTTVTERPVNGGMEFLVPPPGLTGPIRGMFLTGIFVDGLGCAGGVGLWISPLWERAHPAVFSGVALLVFLGWALMVSALRTARSRTVVGVTETDLRIETMSPFGTKSFQWRRDEVAKVFAAPTGTKINDQPITALFVEPVTGRRRAFLKGTSRPEQDWVAARVRRETGISAT